MAVLVAWSKVVAFWRLVNGRALTVAKLIVGARGTAATGVDFLTTVMAVGWGKGFLELVRAKALVFRVKGLGLG